MSLRTRLRKAALVLLDAEDRPASPAAPDAPAAKAVPGAPAKTVPGKCSSCVHFDHEAGQEALRANPAMAQAAATIPPWAMGRKVERDKSGSPVPPVDTSPEWRRAKWSDLGGCELRQEGVFPFHTCPKYEARP